jgi:hypothetical protein
MDVGVQMTYIQLFSKGHEFVEGRVAVGCVGWSNQVSLQRQMRESEIINIVKLQPIPLVDSVMAPISWVANIKFEEEPAVQCARWI